MSWYTVTEYCDYCAYRWIAVLPEEAMARIQERGPVCPRCGLQNDPRRYDDTHAPPVKTA